MTLAILTPVWQKVVRHSARTLVIEETMQWPGLSLSRSLRVSLSFFKSTNEHKTFQQSWEVGRMNETSPTLDQLQHSLFRNISKNHCYVLYFTHTHTNITIYTNNWKLNLNFCFLLITIFFSHNFTAISMNFHKSDAKICPSVEQRKLFNFWDKSRSTRKPQLAFIEYFSISVGSRVA